MPLMPVKPRVSMGFKTPRPMAMPRTSATPAGLPKPPAAPKAGRLSPTGGRIGGTPSPTAPRIPGPTPPKVPTAKAAFRVTPLSEVLATPKGRVLRKGPFKRRGHGMPLGGDFMKGLPAGMPEELVNRTFEQLPKKSYKVFMRRIKAEGVSTKKPPRAKDVPKVMPIMERTAGPKATYMGARLGRWEDGQRAARKIAMGRPGANKLINRGRALRDYERSRGFGAP